MTFEPGQVVTLKSSSQPMTVVAVAADEIDCVWIGDEGEFFRESIPSVALTAVYAGEDDEDEDKDENDENDEDDADGEDEDDAEDESESAGKRQVA